MAVSTAPIPAGRNGIAAAKVPTLYVVRPDLPAKVFEPEIQSAVPEFMRHDPWGALYYGDGHLGRYLDYGLVAVDPAEPDRPVADRPWVSPTARACLRGAIK